MLKRLVMVPVLILLPFLCVADDGRTRVEMPDRMVEHMLGNMRDHLLALSEITRYLANQDYEKAADVAESRLGMSSLDLHGAAHMGKFMPKEMGSIGTNMHKAASRFAIAARDAELEGGLNKAFLALSDVMQQCVACHASYKVH